MAYIGTKPANQVIDSTLIADGTVTTADLANGAVSPAKLSTGAPYWDTSSNVGIGTSSPDAAAGFSFVTTNGSSGSGVHIQSGGTTVSKIEGVSGSINIAAEGSRNIQLYTNSTERMRIDSSGRVTTPFQPAFFVICNSAYTVGNDIVYNEVSVNRGSHYNVGSGRFTAPVAGAYFFSMKNLQTNTSSVIRFYFVLNGTVLGVGSALDGAWQSRIDNNNNLKEQQTSTILNLNAGDYVTVRQVAGTSSIDSSGYSTFLGNLLG
jgi:hypothetical protein